MHVVFFDSGIGGFTVLKDAIRVLPNENYIYYGDTLNAPYGVKPKAIVNDYIFAAVESVQSYQIKALVVACNTATSIAADSLRNRYDFPIIGMEPAIKPAVDYNRNQGKRILVAATPLTLKENKFGSLVTQLKQENVIEALPLPEMVEYAEKLIFDEKVIAEYLRKVLEKYNLDDYSAIVLGCTHFIFYKEIFRKVLPEHINVIDGNLGTANHLHHVLQQNKLLNNQGPGSVLIHLSGREEAKIRAMKQYLAPDIPPNQTRGFLKGMDPLNIREETDRL